jgi:GntR family transcriptional regulator
LIIVEIDLYSDVPSYRQLADQLRAEIAAGRYEPRQPIPSISALQQETGLAVHTIRKGIALLEEEGWVRVVSGRGTFVTESPPQQ